MRTIKFRVWDKARKKYRSEDDGDYSLGVLSGEVRGIYGEKFPEMEVEQFTGLHDKNGKEIYEQMELNNVFIVKWLKFRYVLFYISNLTTFEEIFDYENKLEITGEYTEL